MPTTDTHPHAADVARLRRLVADGDIIRGAWTRTEADGRERAGLLASLSPDAARERSASACPGTLIPPWLAYLTPRIDDCTSSEAWPSIVARYADVIGRAVLTLDADGWRRAQAGSMLAILAVAEPHDRAGVVAPVAALWRRVADGDEPGPTEWTSAYADAVSVSAHAYANATAYAAAYAAEGVGVTASCDAAVAAGNAANAVANAAAAPCAAAADTWDRIAAGVLDAIEAQLPQAVR